MGQNILLLGSYGVGKSIFCNTLSGEQFMRTDTISSSYNKGRHVTSHRELLIWKMVGSLLIIGEIAGSWVDRFRYWVCHNL
jgi:ribosome biogenesis GTPase